MPTSPALDSPRAWFMWGVGTLAYISAIVQRTSFGVAGLAAGQRFEAGASIVSLFVVVQLLTYASAQVPVGVLADRFGTRAVLASGAALMALGQLDLAFSTNLVSAIVARVLVGAGDAMTFGPLLRMLPAWFSASRIPLLNQFVGMTGQLGQIVSAFPFAAVLQTQGWTPAFASAASLAAVCGVVALVLLRNAPDGVTTTAPPTRTPLLRQVSEVVREPASQLGFWIHWMCASFPMLFAFIWGYPFLTEGIGLERPVASALLSLLAIAGLPLSPLVGMLSRRAPMHRSNLALAMAGAAAIPWAAIILWPGPTPVWLLAVLIIGLAAAGPGSNVGFDVARSQVPAHRVGTATGFVIAAGFVACLINILVIGLVLDALGGYTLANFKWAFATQFVFLAVGVAGILVTRRRVRADLAAHGVKILPLRSGLTREWAYQRRLWAGFLGGERSARQRPAADVSVATAATDVPVVAVLPGDAGRLTAVDVPPPDADASWWDARVDDYLALIEHEPNRIGTIEIRCTDADEADRVRQRVDAAVTRRGAQLPVRVVVQR